MPDYPLFTGMMPFVTTEQMREVDRAMIEDYQISLTQMMENAGRNLAHFSRDVFLTCEPQGKLVVVLAGTGGNGGGAMVCARRLHNYGADVIVYITGNDNDFKGVPAHQLKILRNMNIRIRSADEINNQATPDLIIDGIIGYSLSGAPRGNAKTLIAWANTSPADVVALDVPSGVDTTTGTVYDPAIKAIATLTLALPKQGLRADGVQEEVGELYVADISVPPELYASPTLQLNVDKVFATSDIIRIG